MSKQAERGLFELYSDDSERADAVVFGRTPDSTRRGFMRGASLAAMGAAIGSTIPFGRNMPAGFIPLALAQKAGQTIQGKNGLTVFNDRPWNAETPAHLFRTTLIPSLVTSSATMAVCRPRQILRVGC